MIIANKFARCLCMFLAAFGLMLSLGTVQAQTVIYYHTDALGSPVATTNAAGTLIERTEYEPYGQVLNEPVTDGPGYTGHVSDAQTGLSYMQQRYYDPLIGRFLSMDPVTADANTGGNFNRYWYANNNPYRFTDPDGRCPTCLRPSQQDIARWARQAKTQPLLDAAQKNAASKVVQAAPKSTLIEMGGSGGGGSPVIGAAGQGAVGALNPKFTFPDADAVYVSGGAMIGGALGAHSFPANESGRTQHATGGAMEGGLSIGLTNATSGSQLEGASTTMKLNTPAFTATVGYSDSGIWTATVGGPAAGISYVQQETQTKVIFDKEKLIREGGAE